ncbi:LTA synthase family protein [Pygmaiobacter massiliensis]|uniref:LTA synthase family protein n=1 Tax=Pygmaiobacter massiliensis TaxID=1917873 RepID=UPI000C7DA154|nr:LTA synthase family protein [Pygmaiobacter massiliensis]
MKFSNTTSRKVSALLTAVGSFVFLFAMYGRFSAEDGFRTGFYLMAFAFAAVAAGLKLLKLPAENKFSPPVSILLFLGSAPAIFWMVEILNAHVLEGIESWAIVFNWLLIWLFAWVLTGLTGRICLSLRITTVVAYSMGLANAAIVEFRGQPISALDLYSLRTAASVAGGYRYSFRAEFWVGTALLLLIWTLAGFARWKPVHKSLRWASLGCSVAVAFAFFYGFYNTDMLKSFGISDYLWNQKIAFRENGTLLSMVYSTRYLIVEVADDYSTDKVQQIIDDADSYEPQEESVKPNIIGIMNESFADFSLVNTIETSQDPLPFYHSLIGAPNAITGNLVVSTYGGGTCNTEFEFLSGCTLGFFPAGSVVYQQYLRRPTPNLVTTLESQGYSSSAIHPFYGYCWNRNKVYPMLGFDEFLDVTAFPDAKTIGGYMGTSVSDESDYDKLIEMFEKKAEDEKLFLFNVTMQNHGGYSKVVGVEDTVELTSLAKPNASVDNYLSLVRESDKQLERLVSYFSKIKEPTIIVFFGDHQPSLPDSFYRELYGKDLDTLTLTELQKKFKTPFVIWANYDIEEAELGDVSANYLSTLLLKAANLEMPPFQQYLYQLYQTLPVINLNGYQDKNGKDYSYTETSDYQQQLEDYRILQYNLMFDKKNRQDALFRVD